MSNGGTGKKIWFGGDYNPEQWSEGVWDDDVRLMSTAKVNLATVGVFSWARLEPRPGQFDFDWLDRVLDKLHASGIRVDLATATGSPPPWLSYEHPEILPVTENGTRLAFGSRQAYCPSSPIYRDAAQRLVTELALRYADHPGLEMWHVSNEYGCHVANCYCEASAAAFRQWLESKYKTVDALNMAWGTSFWSQVYGSFAEVGVPSVSPYLRNPTQLIDFDRFSSDELLECYRSEVGVLRRLSPGVPVTTNFMGFFKPVDYWKWSKEVDIVSDDSYPDPADPDSADWGAMTRDLMRSLSGREPWIIMEQASGAVNWRRTNARKKAGQNSAWSYQALARGAAGILYFQWRQSVAGAEKFHSGMLPHSGTNTRLWREIVSLGEGLDNLSQESSFWECPAKANVAIVFDWNSWWALEQAGLPASLNYMTEVFAWHRQFTARGIVVDFVQAVDDLSSYGIVVVPALFSAEERQLENLSNYAAGGGSLAVTYQTGITDENLSIRAGGYLGPLQETLGVWIEEFAPPSGPEISASNAPAGPAKLTVRGAAVGGTSEASLWAEVVRIKGAEVVARFDNDDEVGGLPAVTVRGSAGHAWYVATSLHRAGLGALIDEIIRKSSIKHSRIPLPHLEVVHRGALTFAINHGQRPITVGLPGTDIRSGRTGPFLIEPQGVLVLSPSPATAQDAPGPNSKLRVR